MYQSFLKIFIFLVCFTSCKTTPSTSFLELSIKDLLFKSEASQRTITVTSNSTFDAQSSTDWCTVDVFSSSKENLKISVTENETAEDRTAMITINSDGLTELVTVKQFGVEPSIAVIEKNILINEKESLDFTLEVTASISVVFELPSWILEKGDNVSVVGKKTYSFQAIALPEGINSRSADIVVKSANASFGISITIPVTQNKENCILRIASYNIWYERGANWLSFRRTILNNLIRQHDFDIIGTQEGFASAHLSSIIQDGTYAYTGVCRDNGQYGAGATGEHSAIVYKMERFELLDAGDFWYSTTPNIPSFGWGTSYRRLCSWGKFRCKISIREFYVFNSHLDHQIAHARLESVKLKLSKIKEIAGDAPVFAVGDYNCMPHDPPILAMLEGGFGDAYFLTETPPYGPLGTFTSANPNAPPSTSRIDYVFVTKNIRVKEYGVINDRPNGQFPSDHDPVLVVAEF